MELSLLCKHKTEAFGLISAKNHVISAPVLRTFTILSLIQKSQSCYFCRVVAAAEGDLEIEQVIVQSRVSHFQFIFLPSLSSLIPSHQVSHCRSPLIECLLMADFVYSPSFNTDSSSILRPAG